MICSKCGAEKPDDDFYFNKVGNYRFHKCAACMATYALTRKSRRIKWLGLYKVSKTCLCCGFDKSSRALDFHHVVMHEKEHHIGKVLHGSLKRLFAELRKCVVLCANCHRMIHSGELALPVI